MNNPIFFSIVVPTYNRASLIGKTIESILAQTYPHFELIIVDDGSTDQTEEEVKKYLSDKVSYYKKTNAERAAARNYGTLRSKGDYINWFDSDDIMFPDNLSVAVDTIIKYNNPEIFVQGFKEFDTSGQVVFTSDYPDNVNPLMYEGNIWGNSPVMIRRDIALANPYNEDRELSASEDYELWLRLAAKYRFYTSIPKTVGYIYHNDNSTITMSDPDKLISRFTKFIHYTTSNPDIVLYLGRHIGYFIMKNYLLLAIDLVVNKHKKLGLKYLLKSFFSSPLIIFEKGFYAFWKHFISLPKNQISQ